MTEGPSYVDDTMIRQDITDGKDGLPLTLRFIVADAITVGVDPSASAGSGFGGD